MLAPPLVREETFILCPVLESFEMVSTNLAERIFDVSRRPEC